MTLQEIGEKNGNHIRETHGDTLNSTLYINQKAINIGNRYVKGRKSCRFSPAFLTFVVNRNTFACIDVTVL